jgi:hypothetical protein
MTRFVVQTVTGYRINFPGGRSHYGPPGLSAHVCDAVNLFRVVATYASEDSSPTPENRSKRLGAEGALAAAEAHAARWNDGR